METETTSYERELSPEQQVRLAKFTIVLGDSGKLHKISAFNPEIFVRSANFQDKEDNYNMIDNMFNELGLQDGSLTFGEEFPEIINEYTTHLPGFDEPEDGEVSESNLPPLESLIHEIRIKL